MESHLGELKKAANLKKIKIIVFVKHHALGGVGVKQGQGNRSMIIKKI